MGRVYSSLTFKSDERSCAAPGRSRWLLPPPSLWLPAWLRGVQNAVCTLSQSPKSEGSPPKPLGGVRGAVWSDANCEAGHQHPPINAAIACQTAPGGPPPSVHPMGSQHEDRASERSAAVGSASNPCNSAQPLPHPFSTFCPFRSYRTCSLGTLPDASVALAAVGFAGEPSGVVSAVETALFGGAYGDIGDATPELHLDIRGLCGLDPGLPSSPIAITPPWKEPPSQFSLRQRVATISTRREESTFTYGALM